ncbi:MAG: polysaccharide pyruvyl transferase family protein [Pseudomonadota bacterium]
MAKPITAGLVWHSVNSDNLGVGALTASNIAIIEAVAEALDRSVTFRIFGWRDTRTAYISGPNIVPVPLRGRDLVHPSGFFKSVRDCDVVIDIGAGDSFADIYGPRRFLFNALPKISTLLNRIPLILAPQTFGPFDRAWANALARMIVRRATKVVTRDRLSTSFLAERGFKVTPIEATDVAMRLPHDPGRYARNDRIRFGLNVSGLMFNGGYTRSNMFGLASDYADLVRRIIGHFQRLEGCEVHLVAHVISDEIEVEDDFRVCELLAKEFPGTVLAPRFSDPSDAKSYISTMDFFSGARMHACIAAFSSGVPVIPMAYSRKFKGLFDTLGYPWLTDCRSEQPDDILRTLDTGYHDRARLKSNVDTAFAVAQSRLQGYENALREVMTRATPS